MVIWTSILEDTLNLQSPSPILREAARTALAAASGPVRNSLSDAAAYDWYAARIFNRDPEGILEVFHIGPQDAYPEMLSSFKIWFSTATTCKSVILYTCTI